MIVGKSNEHSGEYGALADLGRGKAQQEHRATDPSDVSNFADQQDANQKLEKISQEIVNLYLKIKRCSKDVNITES